MGETRTLRGTIVHHADALAVDVIAGLEISPEATRHRRRTATGASAPAADELQAILGAAELQDLTVADAFAIAPATAAGRRRRAVELSQPVEVEVPLGPGEAAVMLVESEQAYAWQMPEASPQPGGRRRRSGPGVARFRLPLLGAEPPSGPVRRSWLRDRLVGAVLEPIRAVVLKFVAGKVIDVATGKLEESVVQGLVPITSHDPTVWRVGQVSVGEPRGQRDRPRLLLLVHGTFSSTMGSFAALGCTPWGRAFLDRAWAEYDLVLGFDHPTLSVDPVANAEAMLAALAALELPAAPVIDAVAYSRGGLVLRAFAEQLLPAAGHAGELEKAVFVGCTHGGTGMADPENWHTLLDLYTNIAAAGARVVGWAGGGILGTVLTEAVKTLGGLARAIVVQAIEDEKVPGLAAMRPAGALVRALNEAPLPTGAKTSYFAVTADFEPSLETLPPGFGPRLKQLLADRVVDRLIGDANDLVVDTAAMTEFGKRHALLRGRLDFGTTGLVYHTVYFPQADVVEEMTRWLGLETEAATAPVVVEADRPLAEAIERTWGLAPERSFVVTRSFDQSRLYYPRRIVDLALAAERFDPQTAILEALDLHEVTAAAVELAGEVPAPRLEGRVELLGRVRLRNDVVVDAVAPPLNGDALFFIELSDRPLEAASAPPPVTSPPTSHRRRGRPPAPPDVVFTDDGEAVAIGDHAVPIDLPSAPPATVACHVHAEMTEQPAIERPASLHVTLARAALDKPEGPTSVQGSGDFRVAEEIVIRVLPKRNCRVVGADRATVRVPESGKLEELDFEVEGEAAGASELWVVALQGVRRIVTLVLQPVFVARDAQLAADGVGSTAEPEGSLVELLIYEDDDIRPRLLFVLRSDDLGLNESGFSERLRNDTKAAYVDGLYRRLESYFGRGEVHYQDFMDELRDIGSLMYEDLVPEKIRQAIWRVRDRIGSIRVISQEPAIPWELCHIKEPDRPLPVGGVAFFAERGLVRWLHNLSLPPARLTYAGDACRFLVPIYERESERLPGAEAERALVRQFFAGASEVEPTTRSVRQLLQTSGGFDLLHVACHGVAESSNIWEAALVLQIPKTGESTAGDRLGMPTVRMSADLWANRPLVFLNACQLGRQGRLMTGTGGLAEAFIRQGAGLVVGSLWSIADDEALTFARAFYAALTSGRTLIQATAEARAAAAALHEPTWLAYAVYGHPYARLTPR